MPTWKLTTLALQMALLALAGCAVGAPTPEDLNSTAPYSAESESELSDAVELGSTQQSMMDDDRNPALPGGCHGGIDCMVGGGRTSSSGGGGGGGGGSVFGCRDQCIFRYISCSRRCPRPGPDDLLDCEFGCALDRDSCIASCP